MSGPAPVTGGRRKSGASVKTLKRVLKKAGLKVSGKKATLTRRAKKAHLKVKGGADMEGEPMVPPPAPGGRRRRSSRRGFPPLF
jgi:ribosomal protein S6E (S10)